MRYHILLVLVFIMVLTISYQGQGEPRKTGDTTTFEMPGGASIEMVWIEPGMFIMGSPSDEVQREDDEVQHRVTISQGIWLGKCELTQGQWQSVMGTRPWIGRGLVQENPIHPAVYISWGDMQDFIARLNDAEGDSIYRLPTEAEWEYACRAGTTKRWSFWYDESQLRDYAWYGANAWSVGELYAHAADTKLPNLWGLCDMHGNVSEWCWDVYAPYSREDQVDPMGPSYDSYRVRRGGSFLGTAQTTRSANRNGGTPDNRIADVGARLARQGK